MDVGVGSGVSKPLNPLCLRHHSIEPEQEEKPRLDLAALNKRLKTITEDKVFSKAHFYLFVLMPTFSCSLNKGFFSFPSVYPPAVLIVRSNILC